MRLIDADAMILEINELPYRVHGKVINLIAKQQTIEERKKGEWITNLYAFGEDRYECDKCHHTALHCYDFCPNCGADMRGESE